MATGLMALPADVLHSIMDVMDTPTVISFAMAFYYDLRRKDSRIAPAITMGQISNIHKRMTNGLPGPSLHSNPFQVLPTELIIQILNQLRRKDMLRFVLTNYCLLEVKEIAPSMTWTMLRRLQAAAELDTRSLVFTFMHRYAT